MTLRKSLVLAGVASSLALGAPAAVAQPKADAATPKPDTQPKAALPLNQSLTGEAKAEYDSALLLYNDGDFAGASLKFQRAYSLSNDARLLWNAAASEKQLRHYARMYLLVSRYLKEASATLSASEKTDATDLLRTVENFVSHLTVTASEPGVDLYVDDALVATLPTSDPIVADMGTRRISAKKAGFKNFSVERDVIGGVPLALEVKLEPDLKEGTLRITAAADETIRIDGRVVGHGEWQGNLPAGVHSLSVTGPQKKPYQTDVAIEAGQLTTHRVTLETQRTSERSEFVAWPWVAGGVALVALAGVGAYFAFKPDEPPPPGVTVGTISPGSWTLRY